MDNYLEIIPGQIKTRFLHSYLLASVSPRPIAFASTISKDGVPNLAPFSFFNVFSSNPPMLIFSPARRVRDNTTKHTLGNVMEVPEVVVNVVSHSIVHQMNLASTEYPDGVNEFIKAGLTALPSDIVRPFRVAEAPVQMECKVREIKPLGNQGGAGQLIFAEVVKMHINRSILNEDESINPHKIDLVARMGGNFYCRASQEAVFEVEKPLDIPGMGIDALPPHIRFSQVLTGNDLGMLGNMASLPTQREIQDWMRANPDLKAAANKHEIAQTYIRQGKKTDALMLLLSEA